MGQKSPPAEITETAPAITALQKEVTLPVAPAQPETPVKPEPPAQLTAPTIPEVRDLVTLEGVALPVALDVTVAFSLMDAVGKETSIPGDTSVLVVKRSPSGTLTGT